MAVSTTFKHVSYLWDDDAAARLAGDEVALLLYRSNLLGADLRLTNYGGGNTSCKIFDEDPLTGKETEVMWVKGSGGDLGTLRRSGLSALYMDRLKALQKIYRGIQHEDEMVGLFQYCLFDLRSGAPSIDTPLHAFLPYKHIDHLHPDAVIAIAAAKDSERITKDLYGGSIGWVPWQRPGFDLGLKLQACVEENPNLRGIVLGAHGLFTWGDTAFESYNNTLEVIEQTASYLEDQTRRRQPFGGAAVKTLPSALRISKAAALMPVLRRFCAQQQHCVGHFSDATDVLEFINSERLSQLAPMGTSCPDHFLRTKISPLVLALDASQDLNNTDALVQLLSPQFEGYRTHYKQYYEQHKHPDSPAMRDPNPVVILWPGVGMFTFAKDKKTARVAAEFYTNAIHVMKGAESVSEYTALPKQEAFNIEYWLLEEAKLQRLPKPKSLTGKVAVVTGGAGGIGKAIAKKFAAEGACVLLTDNDEIRLKEVRQEFEKEWGRDSCVAVKVDVSAAADINSCMDLAALQFGGIDILVNCAGLSISKPIEEHTEGDWDLLYTVLAKGQFLMTQAATKVLRKQGFGGDVINIVSKNALVAGPNNAAYGSAKAAQLHLSRLNAAELGKDHIRVNVVNPDAVIADSKIWEGDWAEGRAKAYGVSVDQLPQYYAQRTLLNEVILPDDIANACFAFVGGLLSKSTGNVLNVDGGLPHAFVR